MDGLCLYMIWAVSSCGSVCGQPDTYVGVLLSRQDRFGKISYEIIGDDTAPKYFSINPESGQVKLKEKVETDTVTEYQVRGRGHTAYLVGVCDNLPSEYTFDSLPS